MSMREERAIVWSIFSITDQTMKTTMRPIATAATAEMRKDRISSVKSTSVPDRVAAIAVWKITREAASLNSPSLCRVDMIRRGIDTVPATASTATGSGGASIAPSAIAAEMVIPGKIGRASCREREMSAYSGFTFNKIRWHTGYGGSIQPGYIKL